MSRRHARIFREGNDIWIEDLGSANGVFVGQERVQKGRIALGDMVVIGSLYLRLLPEPVMEAAASGPLAGSDPHVLAWLRHERGKRGATEEERDALGKRLGEVLGEMEQLRTALRSAEQEAGKLGEIQRVRGELEELRVHDGETQNQLAKLEADKTKADAEKRRCPASSRRRAPISRRRRRIAAADLIAEKAAQKKLTTEIAGAADTQKKMVADLAALETEKKKLAAELAAALDAQKKAAAGGDALKAAEDAKKKLAADSRGRARRGEEGRRRRRAVEGGRQRRAEGGRGREEEAGG